MCHSTTSLCISRHLIPTDVGNIFYVDNSETIHLLLNQEPTLDQVRYNGGGLTEKKKGIEGFLKAYDEIFQSNNPIPQNWLMNSINSIEFEGRERVQEAFSHLFT